MSKGIKMALIIVIIVAAAAVIYFMFFTTTDPAQTQTSSGLQTSTGAPVTGIINPQPISSIEANKIGQEFVNQLLNLQAIKLDDEIFSSLAFQSLEDFTIVLIQPGNEGRPNPFAPFGADNINPDQENLPGINETDANVVPSNALPGDQLEDNLGS